MAAMVIRMHVLLTTAPLLAVLTGCGPPASAPSPTSAVVAAATSAPAPADASGPPPATPAAPSVAPQAVKVPANQQDAQDNVNKYLQQTLDAQPKGTALDGIRYVAGPGAVPCDDGGVRVDDVRDVDAPPRTDYTKLVTATGDLWRQWGWEVDDAGDHGRLSRVGHVPDGYTVRIEAGQDSEQRPTVTASSPCFPAALRENDIPRTPVLEQSP